MIEHCFMSERALQLEVEDRHTHSERVHPNMSMERRSPASSQEPKVAHTNGWGPPHMRYSVDIQHSPPVHRQTYSVNIQRSPSPPPVPSRHAHQTSSSSFGASQDSSISSISASRYDPYGNDSNETGPPPSMQRHHSHSSLNRQSQLSRRVTSPEIPLQPNHLPPSISHTHHSSPRHLQRKSEEQNRSIRHSVENNLSGNRGVRVTDNTLVYYSLTDPGHHEQTSPTSRIPRTPQHARESGELDITPTPSQSSQSSYDGRGQGVVTSSLGEGYPHRGEWETSSARSSQSDSTHISGTSEPTYNRARPSTRPSSGRTRKIIVQSDPRRAMTPNPAAMINRGEAWQLEDDSDVQKVMTDYPRPAAPVTTVGHMDQALLPQKHYFPTSPSHSSHHSPHNFPTSPTHHSPHNSSHHSSHHSQSHTGTGAYAGYQLGEQNVSRHIRQRHSYAEPPRSPSRRQSNTDLPLSPTYRHSSGSTSHHSSQDFSPRNSLSYSPTHFSLQRRASYASVDSSHSSGSRRSSVSSPMRRSPSLQMHSPSPDGMDFSPNGGARVNGSRRIVSIVDQQVVAPEHVTDHMTNTHSRRHTSSESSLNKTKTKKKHQYERVRAPHPYEKVDQATTPSHFTPPPQPDTYTSSQLTQDDRSELSRDPTKTSKGSPTFKRWKHSLTRKENRPKSSPIRNRALNASDSKLHRLSKKKTGANNSPAPGKRFSAGNALDSEEEEKLAAKMKKRMSSPEGHLQVQMFNRYFPTDSKSVQEGSEDSREQSPSDSDGTPPPKRSGRTKSAGTLVLHKIAKKFSKMSVKSAGGDGGEGSDGSGGGSTSWSAKKAARKKKLRSSSVSNLDSPDEPSRLTQSMEQLNAIPGDPISNTPGGTPTGTPKLTRSSSKNRLARRGSEPDLEGALSTLFRSGSKKNLAADPTEALFDFIEQGNTDSVQQLLYSSMSVELNLSGTNEDDLLPLDLATMLNHEEIAKLLLEKGAKDSAKYCRDTFSRFSRVATLLMEAERELDSLKHELVTQNFNNNSGQKDLERRLRRWEWKLHLLKRMKYNYEHADVPGPPSDVSLHVTSNRSLTVTFTEPFETNGAVVTRYKIEWCRSETFSPIVGEFVMTDLRSMEYVIPDLDKGEPYYVRVSAYNMKGFGPACLASPSSAVPSSWHDVDGSQPRYEGKTNQMYALAAELSMMLSNSPPLSPPASTTPSVNRSSTKTSLKKGITKLFGSNVKFLKTLKSGVYVASMVYSDDSKVLVSVDDHIPIVEVSDSHSSTIGADFVWLAKVACTWEHVRGMCEASDKYTSSPAVQFRNKLLHAILDLQEALGMQDLGLLHPVPYKDKHGAIVFVIVQYLKEAKVPQTGSSSFKWSSLPRLWKRRSPPSSGDLETLPVPDQIVVDAQEIIAYHTNSTRTLTKGLYLGYLKGRSTVASIKVICSREYPNVLPYMKIRNNPNISREEWQWFESLSPSSPSTTHHPHTVTASSQSLQETLLPKIETFLHNLGIAKEDIPHHQLYRREAIELNEDITILLLLPPHEQVCTPPGSTDHFAELADFVALPINTFEIMQLYTYQRTFMSKYSMVSARLEVELLTSQQRMREAFSNADLKSAKQTREELEKYQERAEQAWKQMRWIEEAVQRGRDQMEGTESLLSVATIREGITRAKDQLIQQQQQLTADRRKERIAGPASHQQRNTGLSSGYLRVFPSYATGLVKGTSVKLYITLMTTTTEVIRLVVHQLEKARLERGVPGPRLTEEDLTDFYLVGMTRNKEWTLNSRDSPLSLQSAMCRLEVRRISEQSRIDEQVTSV